MRAGVCSVQQVLTADAASMVKQAVTLARRRGHAQVTPLHVASVMLASSSGLLRSACLRSHSHPLQCKALELCFNVALNRLPASSSSPLLAPHSSHPSLSNALVAAFKRAQAHQRRASIENQQQPILALKVEIEQLIISILHDPSVSRVMREAGFSSTQLRTNIEQAVSLDVCSQSPAVSSLSKESNNPPLILGTNVSQSSTFIQFGVTLNNPFDEAQEEDVKSLLDAFTSKRRRNTVVVGETLASAEGVVRGLMNKFERGDCPWRSEVCAVYKPSSLLLKNLSKEVEQKLVKLNCLLKSYVCRGVVLYLGDLKWVSEFESNYGERRNYCSPVEHIIMELGRMMCGIGDRGRMWLLGTATFQTYMRCKAGHPSLETIWELHPLTIPVGSLGLGLNLDSNLQGRFQSKASGDGTSWSLLQSGDKHLTCSTNCSDNFDKESQSIACSFRNGESTTTITTSTSSSLPSWLQKEKRRKIMDDQECVQVRDLCNKWNSFCSSVHKKAHSTEKALNFSSPSPSSTSISSYDQCSPNLQQNHLSLEPKFSMHIAERNFPIPDLLSNPNSSPNSASSSEAIEDGEGLYGFKELNAENLRILCNALERRVPWQKDIIPEIASTILECRSGTLRGKNKLKQREDKEETWLLFLGVDFQGKEKIAREIAKLVFGSQSKFISIGLSSLGSTRADSTEDFLSKQARDEPVGSYIEKFAEAVHENPHRVFFIEDVEQLDYSSQMGVKRGIESGRIQIAGGEAFSLEDAIIIFSCESFSSVSRASSPPPMGLKSEENEEKDRDNELEKRSPCVSLDLNLSAEDNQEYGQNSVADTGVLDSVDRQFIFKIQEL
ncbi:Protein SMAX1-like 3 [Vitis vinifera]|uniref:Protein SMAX1-like 3 n=1 Tax=Vitis vinifera TaxID=29760 RepID=A0A438H8H3_VITVI|nr:Protein SMAX1-like 3 [Vitis vinifera]